VPKADPGRAPPVHLPRRLLDDWLRPSLRSEAPADHGGRSRDLSGARPASGAGRDAALLPGAGHRTRGRLAAIVDFTFNLGAGRLQTSTLRRRINQRDWVAPGRSCAAGSMAAARFFRVFTFTLLGEQVVAAGRDFWPLLEECVLGIIYPTPILTVKGDFDLRPFAFILRVMAACDGHLSRDEMIIGPLSAASDRGRDKLDSVASTIKAARASSSKTEDFVAAVSSARKIQVNTLQNYTRWPIALLRDLGWATRGSAKFRDGRKYGTFHLTEKGQALAERVEASVDLRVDDVEKLVLEERVALAVAAHFRMLERSGFDIAPLAVRISEAEAIGASALKRLGTDGHKLLFSPFQSLSLDDIAAAFPAQAQTSQVDEGAAREEVATAPDGRDDRSHLFVHPNMVAAVGAGTSGPNALRAELKALLDASKTIDVAATAFAANHAGDTQTAFYPLVT
jgi:hypothetical protein